jgi:DNA-binding NarL/FixJ family response regulator
MPIRVAIIDDHTLVRDALAALLSDSPGLEVIGCGASANDARALVAEQRPQVLLLDLSLSGENGLDLIAPLRRSHPETQVLVLTMHAEPEYARRATELGASGLIAKSAALEELIEAIRRIARGGSLPAGDGLSERERILLAGLKQGRSVEELAETLNVQPRTVETYIQRLMGKLGIHTRAGLIGHARRLEL